MSVCVFVTLLSILQTFTVLRARALSPTTCVQQVRVRESASECVCVCPFVLFILFGVFYTYNDTKYAASTRTERCRAFLETSTPRVLHRRSSRRQRRRLRRPHARDF